MDCLELDCHGYDHQPWHPVELIDIPGTIIILSSLSVVNQGHQATLSAL